MQSASLQSRSALGAQVRGRAAAAAARRQQRASTVRVAAAAETDVGAMFRDALASPAGSGLKKAALAVEKAGPAMPADPVPGTELLRGAAPPQAPPAPSQGMDFVLDQLQSKPPAYAPAAPAAKNFAAQPLDLSDSLSGGAAAASKALGGAADAAAESAKAASEAAAAAAAQAAAAAAQLKGALTGATSGAASGTVEAAQSFVEGAAKEFGTEVGIIRDNIDALVGGVAASVSGAVGGAASAVGGAAGVAAGAAGGAAGAVGGAVAGAYQQVQGLLPPEVVQAVDQTVSVVSAASGQLAAASDKLAGTDVTTAGAAAALGMGVPALLAWQAAYSGYAGALKPEEAMEMLQTQNAVLLDVRTEAARAANGVAKLRRSALGKGVAVPPVRLLPSVARRVRDPARVALEIQALEVAALAKVNAGATRVIVMDNSGESAKAVARALRAAGVRRPYTLAGGFKAWKDAGLAIKQAAEYDASPLDAVGDVAETVVEQAASQLSGLRDPVTAAAVLGALGGGVLVAANFHTALQFIGVLGLELTLAARALSYSSPQDALDDLAGLADRAATLAALPLKTAQALQSGSGAGTQRQEAAVGKSKV